MADPYAFPFDEWDADAAMEAQLARSRDRRAKAARLMLWILLGPIAVQATWVLFGIATVFGIGAVVIPAVVVWIVVRGRR